MLREINWNRLVIVVATLFLYSVEAQDFKSMAEDSYKPAFDPSAYAHVGGAVGEPGPLHLLGDRIYVHPLYNDFVGQTDKLLTHSMWLGISQLWNDGRAIDMRLSWRAITPSYQNFKSRDGTATKLAGVYADWVEAAGAYRIEIGKHAGVFYRMQAMASLNHLGPKGAGALQVGLHQLLDNAWEHLEWQPQVQDGLSPGYGVDVAATMRDPLGNAALWTATLAWQNTLMMNDLLVRLTYFRAVNSQISLQAEAGFAFQAGSRLFGQQQILPQRHQATVALSYGSFWQSSLTWVSSYLAGDQNGQLFLDIINFSIPQ